MTCHAQAYEPEEIDVHDMTLLHDRLGVPLLPPFDALAKEDREV